MMQAAHGRAAAGNGLSGERIEAVKEPIAICVLCAETFFPGLLRVFD
jgi:hypothetical protein